MRCAGPCAVAIVTVGQNTHDELVLELTFLAKPRVLASFLFVTKSYTSEMGPCLPGFAFGGRHA